MTIRRRLFISNLLMILVPVCIAALIAAGCVGAVWYTVRFGGGLRFDDSEDFYQVSAGIAALTEQAIGGTPDERQAAIRCPRPPHCWVMTRGCRMARAACMRILHR